MSSGVTVDSSCVDAYQELKLKKLHKYIVFNLNEKNTEIILEKTGENKDETKSEEEVYEEFVNTLPENECRWVVYDFVYEKEGGIRKKIVLLSWTPDTAKIKQKMLFASSFEALKRSFVGIGVEVQATDVSEALYETILEKANRR